MDDELIPPTQPFGALVPPPKIPGTAVAAATPAPQPQRSPGERFRLRRGGLWRLVDRTLDAVDEVADQIALGLGLRHR
ncbi:MAG TPA: hypothetical protein VI259_20580 [Gemmatimonadaceae bacterium]